MLPPLKDSYSYLPVLSPIYRALRRRVRCWMYAGRGVECPLCRREFRSWVGGEENGTCPNCESFTRHRLLWLFLQDKKARWKRPSRLLYFAPDDCLEQLLRVEGLECTTTDLRGRGVDVHADITKLPFADGSFEAVICSHVLEHVPDDRAALRELFRILRPGGEAFIQVPLDRERPTDEDPELADPLERERRFGQFDHVRRFGFDIVDRLAAAGFSARLEAPMEQFDAATARRYGLWNDLIVYCRKPEEAA